MQRTNIQCLTPPANGLLLQVYRDRSPIYIMHLVFLSGTTTSNSLPIPFNPLLLHRSGAYKQLHRELLCGFDKTPGGAFYQHGRGHSKLESCHYSSIGRFTKDGLEEGAVSEARRMDPSCNAYGRSRDCALGDNCARSASEREGGLLPPSDIPPRC